MILCGRSIGVWILIWANVATLVLGLMFFRNGDRTSAELREEFGGQIANQEQQFALLYHSASSDSRDIKNSAQHRSLFSQPNGLSRGTHIQKAVRVSSSEIGDPLCQKCSQQLSRHLVYRGLVKCFRGETTDNQLKMNGRVLVTSTLLRNNEAPKFEKMYNSVRRNEAGFHIDYSSPKTHPPKNN